MSRAVAELYSALLVVAITLALSYLIFTHLHFSFTGQPVFVGSMLQEYGTPSLLRLYVNSSEQTNATEFRVDSASSLEGVLAMDGPNYTTSPALCAPGLSTFFSVYTASGMLSISTNGAASIDGARETASNVGEGWHEVIMTNASSCQIILPGGSQLAYPSALVSTIPFTVDGSRTFAFLVPFEEVGHTLTIAFRGAVQTYAF
ncbi:MAG: hypothetical protein JRN24_00155 [Nitrososphaerota archaeon]|nr:hypothetical protein [Nitrososphaerota archaeon]